MALPRHGWAFKYRTADNAPCTVERQARHHEWVDNRADVSERSLRRRSQIYGCIRLIESSLRQVHWWYSGSTKDSCQKKQNQHPTVSFHGHVTPSGEKLLPQASDVKRGALNLLTVELAVSQGGCWRKILVSYRQVRWR
jgi:hypothetical protein